MTTTNSKFNKKESTLWLLTACLGLGLGLGMRFVKQDSSVSTLTFASQATTGSQLRSSPTIAIVNQPVYRSVGRTRGS